MRRASLNKQNQLAKQCECWNGVHKVGTRVIVTKDNGERVETMTRSEAYVLSGHTAVIFLEGIAGCYLLSRVEAVSA